jgi:hypothetical protein
MGLAAGIIGAGALSAGASLIGSQAAASAQTAAADKASQTQTDMFNKAQTNLAPYMAAGTNAQNMLTAQLPSLSAPVNMDQATLERTPGYQFQLTQGLKSTQNSAAARGLGVSGAALKASDQYAQGLASSNYQQQFNNALTNKQFTLNALTGQQSLGENAAAGVGNAGIATGNSIASNTLGAGNARGAADIAAGNAVGGLGNSALSAYLTPQLLGGGGLYGSSGSTSYAGLGNVASPTSIVGSNSMLGPNMNWGAYA